MRKFLLLLIMLTNVSDEDLAAAVEAKEIDLKCTLKPWEVDLLASQLQHVQLKNLPQDVKASPAYKAELKFTSNKIGRLKRKPDFRPELLLPKKVAKTGAQRVDKVTKHESNYSMMMMAKTFFLSSIISKARQGQSEEERAASNRQNRNHMAEVGNESNYSMMMLSLIHI